MFLEVSDTSYARLERCQTPELGEGLLERHVWGQTHIDACLGKLTACIVIWLIFELQYVQQPVANFWKMFAYDVGGFLMRYY